MDLNTTLTTITAAGKDPDGQHGSKVAGYLPPTYGPFRCDHCQHYGGKSGDTSKGHCSNPHVINDPKVKGEVRGGGCCNFYYGLEG